MYLFICALLLIVDVQNVNYLISKIKCGQVNKQDKEWTATLANHNHSKY